MSAAREAGIAARLDRMPATRSVGWLVTLLSFGGAFEFYDLFFTAYVVPGLVRSGLLANVKLGIFAGIGIGVELVTIDTYIAELVTKHMRGRAFAFNQTVQFAVVPIVALLAWKLVPEATDLPPHCPGGALSRPARQRLR